MAEVNPNYNPLSNEVNTIIKEAKTKVEWVKEEERPIYGEPSAIEYCEKNYPEMMQEYKRIMWEQYETFCKKQRNYGPDNISVGTRLETKDEVKISLTAYDATKFGRLDGKVEKISADAIANQETGEQYYSIDVKVTGTIDDEYGKALTILPGMVATVEVLAGRRTILDYFWQPLTKSKDAAFRE